MSRQLTAFAAMERIASGDEESLRITLRAMGREAQSILLFDDATGRQVDIDLRVPVDAVPARGRGRPSLGVKAREVTLLPRHWEWLAKQPGGASVALRKLVEAASKDANPRAAIRAAMDAAYAFATAMAGNVAGYEQAMRALYAADKAGFDAATADWPPDVRDHVRRLAALAFATAE